MSFAPGGRPRRALYFLKSPHRQHASSPRIPSRSIRDVHHRASSRWRVASSRCTRSTLKEAPIWATEENKGNVRVEQCGANLCGYAEKTGERVLINMKSDGSKWSGRIRDPDSGRNYDSTIAMKGPNAMRVQGCAFGGMFCGGQTWTRVN